MSKILINITRLLTLAACCFIFTAAPAFAQSQASTGQITGVVKDAADAVVPNATVTLTNKGTNQEQTATTSGDGIYRFALLQPGNYTVKASGSGFGEQILDVEVQVGRTIDANFALGAAGTTAEVTVTAESIQTTRTESDAVINETAINNLPINGRRFQDFATLTPGAQIDPQRGQISLSGQRGINSNINVDGVDFNQPFFGGIRGGERSNQAFTIPQESIREFQVVAAGYSAEFGRSSGGIVNAVTKSGTNDFRGSAFYLIRPRQLSRKNEFVREIERQRSIEATPAPTQQQFGGSIGGPIIKDRLFFFGAYEQQRFRANRQVLFGNLIDGTTTTNANQVIRTPASQEAFDVFNGLEEEFQQTNDAYAVLGKIDWNISDTNRFNVRYNFSRNNAQNANATGETSLDPTVNRALSNNGTEKNRNNIVVAQLVSSFSANLLNDFRFQFAREDRPRIANSLEPSVQLGGVGEFGTRNFLPTTQFDERYQFADSFTIISGNNTLKVGGEFSNIKADQLFGFNQTGRYGIGGNNQTAFEIASLTPGLTTDRRFDTTAASYLQQVGNLSAAFNVQELAFFAQDNYRLFPNFTIDFGLRAEQQYNPDPELGNDALINLVRNAQFPIRGGRGLDATQIPDSGWQFGPRAGFAWDIEGNSKSVLRGFAGLFYARTPLIVLAAPFNNFRTPAGDLSVRVPFGLPSALTLNPSNPQPFLTNVAAFVGANPQYASILNVTPAFCGANVTNANACLPITVYRQFALLGINLNSSSLSSLPTLTPDQINTLAQRVGAGLPAVQPIGIEEDFKNPRSFQFGFAYEREILSNIVVGLDFVNVNTDRLQRNRDLNLPAPILLDPSIDPAQRPYIGINRPAQLPTSVPIIQRPIASLGSVQIRESSARSLYTALTFRARVVRPWGQLNAYYTLSRSKSDDDNERDAGGTAYDNSFNLIPEFGPSRLDRRHQFVANPVIFLPYGFEVASAVRLRSGVPIDVIANADLNGDGVFNDRPFAVPGVPFTRNSFRNRNIYDVDLRVQKGFGFGEQRRLIFSAELFNIFNLSNIQLSGSTVTQYCTPNTTRCGLDGVTNSNFLQVRDSSGRLLLNNFPGSQVFQLQLGARFQF